jgi:hypothetical protein
MSGFLNKLFNRATPEDQTMNDEIEIIDDVNPVTETPVQEEEKPAPAPAAAPFDVDDFVRKLSAAQQPQVQMPQQPAVDEVAALKEQARKLAADFDTAGALAAMERANQIEMDRRFAAMSQQTDTSLKGLAVDRLVSLVAPDCDAEVQAVIREKVKNYTSSQISGIMQSQDDLEMLQALAQVRQSKIGAPKVKATISPTTPVSETNRPSARKSDIEAFIKEMGLPNNAESQKIAAEYCAAGGAV